MATIAKDLKYKIQNVDAPLNLFSTKIMVLVKLSLKNAE